VFKYLQYHLPSSLGTIIDDFARVRKSAYLSALWHSNSGCELGRMTGQLVKKDTVQGAVVMEGGVRTQKYKER
jgi:hypothetical protein